MKFLYSSFIAASTLLLAACSSDIEELTPATDDSRAEHTAILQLQGGIDCFDDAQTRATTADWDDGSVLYIQYQTTSGLVDGVATYSQSRDEWTVSYYGSITTGQVTKCEVYYFENSVSTAMTSVTLNEQTAVYVDNQASYTYEDGMVTLRAHLKPQTGRIRFRGTPGYQFTFTGLQWYSGYNITSNTLSQQRGGISLTVGQDGYTPYVYTTFADATKRELAVDDGDYIFTKSFDTSVLAVGKGGYLNIPTMQSRNGWRLIESPTEQSFNVSGVSFKMIKVKSGTFQMGSETGESWEKPVHSVTLTKTFYIGETEVTQALWKAVTGQTPTATGRSWSTTYGIGDNYPAYDISYEDCQQFITKLNAATGQQFRFPTEAEWEYAARGGCKSNDYTYSGSNTIGDVAWYNDNSGSKTHPVKTKAPNELGIYDMSGNVWEWCQDWDDSYSSNAETNPSGPTSGSCRMLRGGSWFYTAWSCRVSCRTCDEPDTRNGLYGLGLRLAL